MSIRKHLSAIVCLAMAVPRRQWVRARVARGLALAARIVSWKRVGCALGVLALIPFCLAAFPEEEVFTFEDGDSFTASGAILSADGKTLVTPRTEYDSLRLVTNNSFCIWDFPTRTIRSVVRPKDPRLPVAAISSDGRMCAQCGVGKIVVWDATQMKARREFVGNIVVWDTTTGNELVSLPGHDTGEECWGVAFSPDGRRLATWGRNGTACMWSLPDGKKIATPLLEGAHDIAFSRDGSRLAARGFSEKNSEAWKIKVWQVADRALLSSFGVRAHNNYERFAISPDGKTIAIADGWGESVDLVRGYGRMGVQFWDVATGRERPEKPDSLSGRFPRDYDYVPETYLAFSPDEKWVAFGNQWTVGVWDVASGRLRASYGLGGSRRLFPRTGGYVTRLRSVFDADPPPDIQFVTFTPDDQLLVFGNAYDQSKYFPGPGKLTMWTLSPDQ
jgi:WD40 repeat protein